MVPSREMVPKPVDTGAEVRKDVHMSSIDPAGLAKAMERAPITPKRLAEELDLSLTYTCDIIKGRRTLKRNPELRRRIARVLDVPQHWIEHHDAEVA